MWSNENGCEKQGDPLFLGVLTFSRTLGFRYERDEVTLQILQCICRIMKGVIQLHTSSNPPPPPVLLQAQNRFFPRSRGHFVEIIWKC